MMQNHWLIIAHHDSQPLAENNTPRFTTTGSAKQNDLQTLAQYNTMIRYHWLSITQHYSQPLAQHNSP
jgi:hypothetical protein